MSETSTNQEALKTEFDVVAGWLVVVRRLGAGDLAALRRLDTERPSAPVFWRLVADVAGPGGGYPGREERERRYAVVLRTMAELRDVHRSGRRTGRALAEARFEERRLLQLLRARGPALAHAVRTTCHFMVSRGVTIDGMGLVRLVLSEDRPWEERVRRDVARDYFGTQARATTSSQGDQR